MKPWRASTRSLSSFRVGLNEQKSYLIFIHNGLRWAERLPLQQICS